MTEDKKPGRGEPAGTALESGEPRKPSAREQEWESRVLKPTIEKSPERQAEFTTVSGHPIHRLYTPADVADVDFDREVGYPGEPPYTRGIHSTMYRGRLWTMRQFAGFGTPEDTNQRFRYLLEQGQTGLSVAFDLPTLMGYDSDHPLSEGEVGKCGVAISSLADMETLFDKIPLSDVTTSMTINSPAAVIWAMYLAVAEKQGASWEKISGTIQNDILKEYIAQKEYIYPPAPSMRLVIDTFEFGVRHTPRFNVISISGYHIREAGSTAIQELAFTLRDGMEYVEWALRRGLDIDEFGPRLSFFFNSHNDFFEEIAKFRAARRIWNQVTRERYGAKSPRTWALRFHTQTAGCSLTAQQPSTPTLSDAVKAAHNEGQEFGESVARDAPALWLEAVLARRPRMPSDLEARLRAVRVRNVFVGGIATEYCVLETVREALARGFGTVVLVDAIRAIEADLGDGQRAEANMVSLGATLVRQQSASAE